MTPRAPSRRGFTLIEILVATAMVATLAASLYVSLQVVFRARKSALASVETSRKFGQTLELIKADLQSALIPNGILAGPFVGASGSGILEHENDTLTFYTTSSDVQSGPGVGDIKRIQYSCEPTTDRKDTLLLRGVTTNLLAQQTPDPNQEVLCRGLRGFFLRYFDGVAWQENWDSTTQNNVLPLAVEVTLEMPGASADQTESLSLIVPLPCGQADANSSDAASGTTGGTSGASSGGTSGGGSRGASGGGTRG